MLRVLAVQYLAIMALYAHISSAYPALAAWVRNATTHDAVVTRAAPENGVAQDFFVLRGRY
jgi:hypothetical protein